MLSFSCINIVISFFALFNSFFFVYNKSNIIGLKLEEILNMNSYLIVFLISMVPLIELRGAIPYAVGFGIPLVPAYIIAIIGNMLPVPFIYFFARKVLEWGKDKPVIGRFFTFCLEGASVGTPPRKRSWKPPRNA